MIRINLLPVRQTRKLEAARLELSLAVAGGLLVTVLASATWALFTWQLSATQDENAALQAEIDRLAAIAKSFSRFGAPSQALDRPLEAVDVGRVVADVLEFVPELTEKIKEAK